mgnify:CR=1 FL=1
MYSLRIDIQRDGHAGADALAGDGRDFAGVFVDDPFGDGEAEAAAAGGFAAQVLTAVKAVEDAGELGGRDAHARVLDDEALATGVDGHAAILGVFEGDKLGFMGLVQTII